MGFGILLIFSITAVALGYATYKTTKLNQALYEVPVEKSKTKKYKIAQSDNVGFVGDDEVGRVHNTDSDITVGSECNNGVAVVTQNLNHDNSWEITWNPVSEKGSCRFIFSSFFLNSNVLFPKYAFVNVSNFRTIDFAVKYLFPNVLLFQLNILLP